MLLFTLLLSAACQSLPSLQNPFKAPEPDLAGRITLAERTALEKGFTKRIVETDSFALVTFGTLKAPDKPVHIYIEGDGYTHYGDAPATNPTPVNPVALRLAAGDPYDNVIYIARPCQFIADDPKCAPQYWTSHSTAPEVINAVHQTLNHIKAQYGMSTFHLIGYGGGGAVSAILAANRNDILSLRTVAGNLDHLVYASAHEKALTPFSLNAADFAPGLEDIPQVHFTGADDVEIPVTLFESFKSHMYNTDCVRHEVIQNTGHEQGWAKRWPALLIMKPLCKKSS